MGKKIVLLLIVASFALGALFYSIENQERPTNQIAVSGTIEVTEVGVSFEIAGRVLDRFVDEGDSIALNQPVATLDERELVQEVRLREAELEAANAHLLELVNGYLPEEIAQAEAQVEQTLAEVTHQKEDYARQESLYTGDVISKREFDTATAAFTVAKAKHWEAVESLAYLERGIREEKIAQAEAQVKQAQDTLQIAKTRLSYARIGSPTEGLVLSKNIEPGEFVQAGVPIVTVGDMDRPWLRAYVKETDLGKIKVGQNVSVTTDTYPGKIYEGHISFIASEAEFTPKNVQTEEERVKLVYRIKVRLDNPHQELKPGMPADGIIALDM